MTTKLQERWVLLLCPECRGAQEQVTQTHSGDCPNRSQSFVPVEVVVVPESPCSCPKGWATSGHYDPRCARHGRRDPAHTVHA